MIKSILNWFKKETVYFHCPCGVSIASTEKARYKRAKKTGLCPVCQGNYKRAGENLKKEDK